MMATWLLLSAALLAVGETHTAHDHPAAGSAGPAAVSVPLFDDLGTYHRAVSTKKPLVQKYFDQGLRLVYGFNHDEAERAFREAARLDPKCAPCFWGVALTLGPNINLPIDPERNAKAVEAVSRAKSLESRARPVEKALIDALSVRYSAEANADRATLDQAYADAMRGVVRRFPDDDDAATLFAESLMDLHPWKLWTQDGQPAPGTLEAVSSLETVLKRNPTHPGANHYYIHATEASPDPGRALASAKRLETLVPGAGHLVHMPAHTYMRTGDYAGASAANDKAAKVDEAYIAKTHAEGVYPAMYYTHNLQFLAAAAAMEGRSMVSLEAARKTTEIALKVAKDMPMAEFVVPWSIYYSLRFGKLDDVLALPAPDPALPTATALWRFGRAYALAAVGKMDEAAAENAAFEAARAAVPADAMMNLSPSSSLLAVAAAMIQAKTAEAKGQTDAAIAAWKNAVELEDALPYDEPPAWYYPTRESLGGACLRAGKFPEAEAVFREDLERNPGNARSLFGLAKALEGQQKSAEAAKVEKQFKEAWKAADVEANVTEL